ncbi:hypothetical protein [Nocardiopsis potens]|uniref:hypothetical protein n=1 Tax=Nocardiopsis potens TaxID=1246458 RepID=UPI0003480D67|nr:hypothetical protein [Nocardiopsis potens]
MPAAHRHPGRTGATAAAELMAEVERGTRPDAYPVVVLPYRDLIPAAGGKPYRASGSLA